MWTIAQQPIYKSYSASIFSRSFCIIGLCYIAAIIVPILILTTIGYSWSEYTRISLIPSFTYANHQITCIYKNSNIQTLVYESSFSDEDQVQYFSSVAIGSSQQYLDVTIQSFKSNILSCTYSIYLNATLDDKTFLVILPLSAGTSDYTGATLLNQIDIYGTVQLLHGSPLANYRIPYSQQNSYYTYGQDFSMMDNIHRCSRNNATLKIQKNSIKRNEVSSTTSLKYNGKFKIKAGQYAKQTSLLNKIREFIPYFIYLLVITLGIIVIPVTRWVLTKKIYTAKYINFKLKRQ